MTLEEGKVCITLSGRETSPVPKVDFSTDRKSTATMKRVNEWLIAEATAEAMSKNDDYTLTFFDNMETNNLSIADKDHINDYLFGDM